MSDEELPSTSRNWVQKLMVTFIAGGLLSLLSSLILKSIPFGISDSRMLHFLLFIFWPVAVAIWLFKSEGYTTRSSMIKGALIGLVACMFIAIIVLSLIAWLVSKVLVH